MTLEININPLFEATEYLLKKAKELGADAADCSCDLSQNLEVAVRLGALENVERAESMSAGLRVIIGKSQAGASTSSLSKPSLDTLAERVVAMARLASEDKYCGLADSEMLAKEFADLELIDPQSPDIKWLEEQALECEAAALEVPKIENIAGCGASWHYGHIVYGATNGFIGGYGATNWGLGIAPVAQNGDERERDFESSSARYKAKLESAAIIGKKAGERAARRLGPTKIASANMPVILESRVARSIIGLMIGAISGSSVARGISFLKDKLGQQVFADNINIIDNPFIKSGFGSRPFDGEGVKVEAHNIIENGILNSWLLNTSSAMQLGLKSNGHASLAQGGPHGIGISNFVIANSQTTREELIKQAHNGIFITEAMSPSFNPNNGDYSVGVSGIMIENGVLTYPVSEITIASNMFEIYKTLQTANDSEMKSAIICPSIIIPNMTIAGA